MSGRSRSAGPRVGTRPCLALTALHRAGGTASQMQWMRAADSRTSAERFEIDVVYYLVNSGMVAVRGSVYAITPAGLAWLGRELQDDVQPSAPAQVAGPRYVADRRPLSARHMVRAGLVREGALAYADIPSRYGDQRVAHLAKVPTA